jgi:hypothetical protein
MSAQANNPGTGHQSATIGLGNETSGEAGSTLTHETMAETGGSGVNQQSEDTALQGKPGAGRPADPGSRQDAEPEGAGTASTATVRGAQDTRSSQAGRLPTGLGTPETGGNQNAGDLAPPRQE